MGPLLALVFIALAGIFAVGVVTGGLSNIFEILFTFFPYFIALGIGLFILARIGNFGLGRNQNDNGLLAGLIGALTGAGISELRNRRSNEESSKSFPDGQAQSNTNINGQRPEGSVVWPFSSSDEEGSSTNSVKGPAHPDNRSQADQAARAAEQEAAADEEAIDKIEDSEELKASREREIMGFTEDEEKRLEDMKGRLEDLVQHEDHIANIIENSQTMRDFLQNAEPLEEDVHMIHEDLKQIQKDYQHLKKDLGEESKLHEQIEQLEQQQKQAFEELEQHIESINRMERGLDNFLGQQLESGQFQRGQ
jgi:hypothetical protein